MKLTDVTLSYGKKVVAQGINAELLPGELVLLVGRNGAGKSTLIRHILRMGKGVSVEENTHYQENEGSLPGQDCKHSKANRKASKVNGNVSRLISVVLTDKIDVERLTVREVVAMGRMPYTGFFGRLGRHDEEVVSEALRTLGMEAFACRQYSTLSDGERQKAIIAKALAQETPYILLDEPTAFLDHPSKVSTMQLLQRLCREQGKAILISTHDLEVSLRHCDRVWYMSDGTLRTLSSGDCPLQ